MTCQQQRDLRTHWLSLPPTERMAWLRAQFS